MFTSKAAEPQIRIILVLQGNPLYPSRRWHGNRCAVLSTGARPWRAVAILAAEDAESNIVPWPSSTCADVVVTRFTRCAGRARHRDCLGLRLGLSRCLNDRGGEGACYGGSVSLTRRSWRTA